MLAKRRFGTIATLVVVAAAAVWATIQPVGAYSPAGPVMYSHVAENALNSRTENGYDTILFASYAGGRANVPDAGPVEVWVLWLNESGGYVKSATGERVCDPCTIDLNSEDNPKGQVNLHSMVENAGGFSGGMDSKRGFLIVTVIGGGADAVGLEAMIINNWTGNPFKTMTTPLTPNYLGTAP